ncbi:unnamed protein product [Prorocentrum cordatum]|uniref:RRM domain-containing protein n=1 Tax=Prorocentrum cordatum TaxID=2364126 RepID=A0ABN9Q306_9DINO|nr:unnamed protein product [Polarella glacialis]
MATPCKLFIGNLPADVTQDELKTTFQQYGQLQDLDVHIMAANRSRSGATCAFLVFSSAEEGQNCIEACNMKLKLRESRTLSPSRRQWPGREARRRGYGQPMATVAQPQQVMVQPQTVVVQQPAAQPQVVYIASPAATVPAASPTSDAARAVQVLAALKSLLANPLAAHLTAVAAPIVDAAEQQLVAGGHMAPSAAGAAQAVAAGAEVLVGNLPLDITSQTLQLVFNNYGRVLSATPLQPDAASAAAGRTSALVAYSTATEAQVAALTLHEKYEIRPGYGNITVQLRGTVGAGVPAAGQVTVAAQTPVVLAQGYNPY